MYFSNKVRLIIYFIREKACYRFSMANYEIPHLNTHLEYIPRKKFPCKCEQNKILL